MIRRRTAPFIALIIVSLLALGACGSDDTNGSDDGGGSTTTATSGPDTFTATPSSEWGDLAKCPLAPQSEDPGGTAADEGIDGVLQFGKLDQTHVEKCVDYPVHPAVGGAHFPVWANCGFYHSPVPEEVAVHVLEHGGVWIAFDATLAANDITAIKKATAATTHILASPYPGLRNKVVLSAWSRQLALDSTSDPRFQKFIDTYLQGPNTPELGAACSGGMGTPG